MASPQKSQKYNDLAGPAAWKGGVAAVNAASPRDVIFHYVHNRLQAIARIMNQKDPTKIMDMNFEAMLMAIQQMSPIKTMTYDFKALRGLYAKHTGALTPEQNALVSEWERTVAGQHVGRHLNEVLCTCWRDVPAVYFGDSGSVNKFNKTQPSMLSYCREWLVRPLAMIDDRIKGGANIVDWLQTFEENLDAIAPPREVRSYNPDDLAQSGWNSVRSDALVLQEQPPWVATHFTVSGHLSTERVFVVVDCMNSGMAKETTKDSIRSGAFADDYIRQRRASYEKFFQMASQRFHKIIYVKSPDAEFWKINKRADLEIFRPMWEYAEKVAIQYGAVVIDGTNHFSSIERYRKQGDPWHYRSQDTEFCLLWEVLFQNVVQLSQFMPDHLYNYCCQSFPDLSLGPVSDQAVVQHPEVKVSPPNTAVVEPTHTLVDPECVAEMIDNSRVILIPVDDVKVELRTSRDGRQWLGLTYDCIQTPAKVAGELRATVADCSCGGRKVGRYIHGPRRRSCNTDSHSDRLVTPSLRDDPLYEVAQVQKMVKPQIISRDHGPIRCTKSTVMVFDGCSTHTTLGYMLPDYGPIFRQMFDASLAMLPEGSHFVSGAKVNHKVLPNKASPKAHSYMIDLDRQFMFQDNKFAQWVGEFFPAYDLVIFIEAVWRATNRRINKLVEDGTLTPAKWPAEEGDLALKTNLHCSLPANDNNNIAGGNWDGITHCSYLSVSTPDTGVHSCVTGTMNDHFERCLSLVEVKSILRTHLDGHYVFNPVSNPLLEEITDPPHRAGEDPVAAETEELERAEEIAANSAGCGAAYPIPAAREDAANEPPIPAQKPSTQPKLELSSAITATLRAPLSVTNTIVNAAVRFSNVMRGAYSGGSHSHVPWFARPREDKERVSREWSASIGREGATPADSTRSGAVAVSMEVEIPEHSQEELQRARDMGLHIRPSLSVAYNRTLQLVGPAGLVFKMPTDVEATAAPAAAAIPAEEPPAKLLACDIYTDSEGTSFNDLGHEDGWPGIAKAFNIEKKSLAFTGFEPENRSLASTIPEEWRKQRCLWWDPNGVIPAGYYWREVDITHPSLQLSQLSSTGGAGAPPTYSQILDRWFNGCADLFKHVCHSLTMFLRHTGGRGTKSRPGRRATPAVPMATYGWVEMHHLCEAIRAVTDAGEVDAAAICASIRNDTTVRKNKLRYRFMMLMAPRPADSAGSGAPSASRTDKERPASAIVMKEDYYQRYGNMFAVPSDAVLKASPFLVMRADHGHGDLFDGNMECVQRRAYADLLNAGSGLFHATKLENMEAILRDGILKMGRAASMFSMFHHLDPRRSRGLQRFGSAYDIIISIRSTVITDYLDLDDMFVASGLVSIQKSVPRFAFDRIVQPNSAGSGAGRTSTEDGIVWFDAAWATRSVEGVLAPQENSNEEATLVPASRPEETDTAFEEKAKGMGWDGPIFSCPGCYGVNPCGMLLCLHCHVPFLFGMEEYPGYLVSPMANRIIARTAEKCCPEVTVPDPVRLDTAEISRVSRFGAWTNRMSLSAIVKEKLKSYFRWQRRWYSDSAHFNAEEFRSNQLRGCTPYCPGPVCSYLMDNGLHVERAPASTGPDGIRRDNLWNVCEGAGDGSIIKLHSLEDLNETTPANAVAIRYANELFVDRQNAGLIDETPIDPQVMERFFNQAYFEIFGVDPRRNWFPDSLVTDPDLIAEVQSWGRSVNHGRTRNQASRAERDAIASFMGGRIPTNPAEAHGGKANKGGYFPGQAAGASPPGKGKKAGRSSPYPQAASSSSSGSSWRWSTGWDSWTSWQGGSWSSRGWRQ